MNQSPTTPGSRPLRALWFAAILAAIVALCAGAYAAAQGPHYYLELHATSSVPARMQLFYDVGHWINDTDSSIFDLDPNVATVVRLALPNHNYSFLRLDPLNRPGSITLTGICIRVGRNGRIVATLPLDAVDANADIASLKRMPGGLAIETTPKGEDSNLILHLPGPLPWNKTRETWKMAGWGALFGFLIALPICWLAGILLLTLSQRQTALLQKFTRLGTWAAQRPARALACVAVTATLLSCYPVIFFGKSFLSPGNGGALLVYESTATITSQPLRIENIHAADVGATMWAFMPYGCMERHALLEDHELPLWNRYASCGLPLMAQGISMAFDPLHWPAVLANSAAWAWDAQFVVARFLFCLGAGLLIHAMTRSLRAAAAVAGTVAFLGFWAFRVNHPAIFTLCYSPWLILPFIKIQEGATFRARTLWAMVLILAATCQMNSGTAKEAYVLIGNLFVAGGVGVLLQWRRTKAPLQAMGIIVASVLLLVAINSPTLVQFYRNLGPPRGFSMYDHPAANQFLLATLANYFENIFSLYEPAQWLWNPSVNFMLMLGVLWALARFGALWRNGWFMVAFLGAIANLATAFSVVPPQWITAVPILRNVVHVGNAFSVSATPFVIILAGFGFADFFSHLHMSLRRLLAILRSVVFMALAIVILNLASLPQFERSGFFYGYLGLVLASICLLPVIVWRLARHKTPVAMLLALAVCVILPHIRHGAHLKTPFDDYFFHPSSRVPFDIDSAAINQLRASAEPYRVTGFSNTLMPGFRGALELESDDGPDAMMNGWYRQLEEPMGLSGWRLSLTPQDLLKNRKLYDMINRRYYAAMPGAAPDIDGLTRVVDADLQIFESPTAWPRAFFSDRVASYARVQDFADMVLQGDGKPFAAIQQNDPEAAALTHSIPSTGPRTGVPATAYRLTSNSTTFDIAAPGPGVVVLSETYFDQDFRVSVNGTPSPYFRVNQAFKGIALPAAGTYHITFDYWPKYLTATLFATGGATLAALAWLIAACVIRPKPGAPESILP